MRLLIPKNHEAVEKLSYALNHDRFYGVRIEAARALQSIHDDDALAALLKSTKQDDARVRNRVMAAIAGFYDPKALEAARKSLADEHNPDIQSQNIRALSKYSTSETRPLLVPLLQSQSYRNATLEAAISTLSDQEDPENIAPIRDTLKARKSEMQARGFSTGLSSLATLALNCEKKSEVRDFIIGYVADKNETIQLGAIRALGTLGDPGAIPVLQTFAGVNRANLVQRAASAALEAIRAGRKRDENSAELRQTVQELQDQMKKLRQDMESMQKKQNATERVSA